MTIALDVFDKRTVEQHEVEALNRNR